MAGGRMNLWSVGPLRIARSALGPSSCTLRACYPASVAPDPQRYRHFSSSSRRDQATATARTNHYATLGVDRTADAKAIKGAYYKLAKTYHPDINKAAGASDKFMAIQNAYNTLSDEDQRKAYDRQSAHSSTTFTPSRSPFSGFSGPSRPAGYYDPFSRAGNTDYRTTYTYEDLRNAATGNSRFYTYEFDDWEDVMDDEDMPPGYDPWEDGMSGGEDRTGFTSYYGWDDLSDLGAWANPRSKQDDFDDFLARMARQAGQNSRTMNGSFSPSSKGGKKGAKDRKKKAQAYEYAFNLKFGSPSGPRRPGFYSGDPLGNKGPEAAAAHALNAEKAQRRSESQGSKASKKDKVETYGASVIITQSAARQGTVLKHVPVSLASVNENGEMECAICDGTGKYYPRVKTSKCGKCRGKGFMSVKALSGQKQRVDCYACNATGYHAKVPRPTDCNACDGTGVAHAPEDYPDGITVRVKVPPKTQDQDILYVPIGRKDDATARVMVRVAP